MSLLDWQAVPLDPIGDIARTNFGERVQTTLRGFGVINPPDIPVTEGLTLREADLLVPTDPSIPLVLTRDSDLNTGDYLTEISLDGYLIDSSILGLESYGARVIVVEEETLDFTKGTLTSTPQIPPVGFP